jgi:hypothetical protein
VLSSTLFLRSDFSSTISNIATEFSGAENKQGSSSPSSPHGWLRTHRA